MCVKVPSKWDLRRLTGAVNATALVRLGPPTADEAGSCDLIEVRESTVYFHLYGDPDQSCLY